MCRRPRWCNCTPSHAASIAGRIRLCKSQLTIILASYRNHNYPKVASCMKSVVNKRLAAALTSSPSTTRLSPCPATVINQLIPGNITYIYEWRLRLPIGMLTVSPPLIFCPIARKRIEMLRISRRDREYSSDCIVVASQEIIIFYVYHFPIQFYLSPTAIQPYNNPALWA